MMLLPLLLATGCAKSEEALAVYDATLLELASG